MVNLMNLKTKILNKIKGIYVAEFDFNINLTNPWISKTSIIYSFNKLTKKICIFKINDDQLNLIFKDIIGKSVKLKKYAHEFNYYFGNIFTVHIGKVITIELGDAEFLKILKFDSAESAILYSELR